MTSVKLNPIIEQAHGQLDGVVFRRAHSSGTKPDEQAGFVESGLERGAQGQACFRRGGFGFFSWKGIGFTQRKTSEFFKNWEVFSNYINHHRTKY